MSPDLANPRNRRLLQFSLRSMFLVTLLVAVIAFYLGRGLKVENIDKIKVGMTEREVERLLGGAPGDYGTKWGPQYMTAELFVCDGRVETWTNDNTWLEVCFDADGTVISKHKYGYSRESLIAHWLQGKRSR